MLLSCIGNGTFGCKQIQKMVPGHGQQSWRNDPALWVHAAPSHITIILKRQGWQGDWRLMGYRRQCADKARERPSRASRMHRGPVTHSSGCDSVCPCLADLHLHIFSTPSHFSATCTPPLPSTVFYKLLNILDNMLFLLNIEHSTIISKNL